MGVGPAHLCAFSCHLFLLSPQIELGRGLGKDGLRIKQLLQDGYECVFIGIGRYWCAIVVAYNTGNRRQLLR